jgi:hypothetical protein
MNMKRIALATLAAGVWINVSEFLRNEILFKEHWLEKYETLGLEFPSAPLNGALWGLWGFIFAGCIVAVRRQSTLAGTIALCWTLGFALMWIVIGNLNVLPLGLLPIAVPWSLAEVALAVVLAQKIMRKPEPNQSVDGTR